MACCEFKSTFTESNALAVTFEDNAGEMMAEFGTFTRIMPDPYEGDYTVIPKVTAQTLPTKKKSMTDDVTVTEIPYSETENESGKTATIAS